MKPSLLIPAFRPTRDLIGLTEQLVASGTPSIVVIDDGSGPGARPIFDELADLPRVTVLRHAVNLGKGRSLKTGLNHYLLTQQPGSCGIVTLDADGQHLPKDVLAVAEALESEPGALHLGVRSFDGKVPLRSLLGNHLTRYVFGLATGIWVKDTQTGLRGIPRALVPALLSVSGERYEYEIGMLLRAKEERVPVKQHGIETVYIDQNRGSHFNPVLDSMRIYFVLLRFTSSSMLTALVDFIVFSIVHASGIGLAWSLVSGRVVASAVQFTVNRSFVFRSTGSPWAALIRYYLLVAVLGVTAYFLIDLGRTHLGANVVLLKAIVETTLFFASYGLQSALVFGRSPENQSR